MKRLPAGSLASGLYVGILLTGAAGSYAQRPIDAPQSDAKLLDERIERLGAQLNAAQAEVEALRTELQALRHDVQTTGSSTQPPASAGNTAQFHPADQHLERLQEDEEVIAAQVKQHEQTKVESTSKYPVRIRGLVLFNTFVNAGVVDQVDLPTSALRRAPGASHGSAGGSMRQTWLGLEGTGPVLGSFRTSARVDLDFFGGVTQGYTSGQTSAVRLRTAAVRVQSEANLFEARYDQPLISPLSPTSLAQVAQPALAWTGNLWTWAPELRWAGDVGLGRGHTFQMEAGLRDPYYAAIETYPDVRAASPGEASRQPAYEGRFSFGSSSTSRNGQEASYTAAAEQGWRVGGGGYYAKQLYANGVRINTWALTADWHVPLQRWLQLTGEAYRGTGLGGLGGGAYRDVVQGTDPVTGAAHTLGLDAAGGWAQLQANVTPRWQINAAFGQDAGSGSELRLLTLPAPGSSLGFYARNRAMTGNLIYRPWSSVVLSPEFRRLVSWPTQGQANVANVFTLSAGYQF